VLVRSRPTTRGLPHQALQVHVSQLRKAIGVLLARGGAGDAERAPGLLEEAVAVYRELGMEGWATRALALS
jgi:hypothetical protein